MARNATTTQPSTAKVGYVTAQIITANVAPFRVALLHKPDGQPLQIALIAVTGSGRVALLGCKMLYEGGHAPAQLIRHESWGGRSDHSSGTPSRGRQLERP